MDFDAVLTKSIELLQRAKAGVLSRPQLRFQLDDETLDALKDELIYAKRSRADEEGRVLVWTGARHQRHPTSDQSARLSPALTPDAPHVSQRPNAASSRCYSVTWWTRPCSPASSTPKSWREVVRAYQEACAKVIARYEGHIAQYLGDGLLVYFGYPQAHEDDAQRAVRAGLGIVEAMAQLNTRLEQERGVQLAVRLGIHTGLVVVGEMGGGDRQEQLALGETPNIAARLQGIAAPNTLVISAATLSAPWGLLCLPVVRHPAAERLRPTAGDLSGAV